jgi:hypothetical protein
LESPRKTASRATLLVVRLPWLVLALSACGGKVVVDAAGGGGSGGGFGGSSVSATSSGGATVSASSGSVGDCAPLATCDGACVDTDGDGLHCGSCTTACGGGEICVAGNCLSSACSSVIEAEDGSQVQRSAGWAVSFGAVLHAGSGLETYQDSSTDTLALSFTGTGLVFHNERGPNRGDLLASVDGGAQVTIEGFAPDFVDQIAATIAVGLPFGPHAATLACTAGTGYCTADSFDVLCQ